MAVLHTNTIGLRYQRESAKLIRFAPESWLASTNVEDALSEIVTGPLQSAPPSTHTVSFTQQINDAAYVCNGAATITITMLSAASVPGQWLYIKTIAAFTVVSASSNVVPLNGGAPTTAILAATIGKWASLVSDGVNWIIMASN